MNEGQREIEGGDDAARSDQPLLMQVVEQGGAASAALQDTHTTVENFGDGPAGMLDIVRR